MTLKFVIIVSYFPIDFEPRMLRPLHHMSDQELVERLPVSESAFTEIYNRYWDKLLFVAALKLQNTAMAEEVVQEIFVDIWNRRERLSITVSLEAYLSVAVKYRIINAQLKLRREQDFISRQQEPVVNADHELDEKELQKHYQLLISQLPEKCRITYRLSREEGLTLKEISRAMSVSQKAVEANLTRSIKLLRFGLRKIMF
jgi:RNA polymerase sigma-70 factor (family 1)